jgi:hypothetical protein
MHRHIFPYSANRCLPGSTKLVICPFLFQTAEGPLDRGIGPAILVDGNSDIKIGGVGSIRSVATSAGLL